MDRFIQLLLGINTYYCLDVKSNAQHGNRLTLSVHYTEPTCTYSSPVTTVSDYVETCAKGIKWNLF